MPMKLLSHRVIRPVSYTHLIVEKDGLFTVKGKAAPIVTPVKPALPDGTSDDVTAEIKPATAVVLGVDTTKSAITEETLSLIHI